MALFLPRQRRDLLRNFFLSLPLTDESPSARRPATGFLSYTPAIGAVMHSCGCGAKHGSPKRGTWGTSTCPAHLTVVAWFQGQERGQAASVSIRVEWSQDRVFPGLRVSSNVGGLRSAVWSDFGALVEATLSHSGEKCTSSPGSTSSL
ncbi:hypothetical protein GE21DRAFT_1087575 [Neurospora crassa]|nr:hypothetical protein GE21DRAFT_1087575 [Neurospora crassa]